MHWKSVLLMLAFLAFSGSEAQATLQIESHNDPAGDPTPMHYRVSSPSWSSSPFEFDLVDRDYRGLGVPAGIYTIEAFPPAGWYVGDIRCDPVENANDFAIDVANGRVVVNHSADAHHFCTFTNRKGTQSSAPSPGVSPAPPPALVPKALLSKHPALVDVRAGRGYAEATIRITRRSVIKGLLQRRKSRVVGSKRIVRRAGTHVIRVKLQRERMRRMQRRGLKHVTLTFRIIVAAKRSGATHVFKHRVLIKL